MPTTHTNTVNNASLAAALGSPTLDASDTIRINEDTDYDYTASGGDLGSTAITAFYHDPGSHANLGSGSDGIVVQATTMVENSNAPRSLAYEGLGSGTVGLFHWEPLANPVGFIKSIATLTKLRVMSGGLLTLFGSCVVTSLYMGGIGNSVLAQSGDAMTTAVLGNANQTLTLERDCTTVKLLGSRCTLICNDSTATPGTVEVYNNSTARLLSGTVTIKAGSGATIDLSKATGNLTITWEIAGDITIIEPPTGVTYSAPSDAEILSGTVTVV